MGFRRNICWAPAKTRTQLAYKGGHKERKHIEWLMLQRWPPVKVHIRSTGQQKVIEEHNDVQI